MKDDPPDLSLTPTLRTKVAQACLSRFSRLSKSGKPRSNQWTVFSGLALVQVETNQVELVSLATGTKCLDGDTRARCPLPGSLLHDCHAEVLARRGLVCWLLEQVGKGEEGKFLVRVGGRGWGLKEGWKIVLFSTYPPCGDASIFAKKEGKDILTEHQVRDCDTDEPLKKRFKESNSNGDHIDMNRTGAKVIPGLACDPLTPSTEYHRLGVLRTKPGRGVRTASLSCSDKMLKWNLLGLQGSLCSHLFPQPLHLHSFLLAGQMFDLPALQRALYLRAGDLGEANQPHIHHVEGVEFEFSRRDSCSQPSPDSIIWVNLTSKDGGQGVQEAITEGHKQGWSAKKLNNPKAWSLLCERKLLARLMCLMDEEFVRTFNTYSAVKEATTFHKNKLSLKSDILRDWPIKDSSIFSSSEVKDILNEQSRKKIK